MGEALDRLILRLAQVQGHTRRTKSGKIVRVRPYVTKTGSASALAKRMREGGFTFDFVNRSYPKTGFVVALPGHGKIFKREEFNEEALVDWIDEKVETIGENPRLHLGGWYDKQHDEYVLDLVELYEDGREAVRLGRERNEQAIFDLSTMTEIETGGTGGREQA